MTNLYRPLCADRHEIRLLEILPAPFEADIRCGLLYTTLQSPGPLPYEALSYVWGKPEFTEPLDLDGHPFLVTKNLAMALRHLRPDAGKGPRRLWVDAICINQHDVEERNHQVTLMSDIYSHCLADLAWLGPDSSSEVETAQQGEDLALGFELLRKLTSKDAATLSSLKSNYEMKSEYQRRRRSHRRLEDNFLLSYTEQRPIDAVLLQAPLWSRIWVMQELALAPRVILVAGLDTLEWDSIAKFLGDTSYADAFHLSWSHGMLRPATLYTFERAQIVHQQRNLARDCAAGRAVSTLMDVLGRFKFADATDPRDKIYGLLGLVSEKHPVRVDYNRPWYLVYADLCQGLIGMSGTLDIICQNPWTTTSFSSGETQLPSWAADLSSNDFSGLSDGFSALLFAQRGLFKAGSQTCQVPCKTSDDGATLHCKATTIGTVGHILQEDYHVAYEGESRSSLQSLSTEWFERTPREWMVLYFGDRLLNSTDTMYDATGEPALEAFWRTLVMDCKAFPIERLSQNDIVSDGLVFQKLLSFSVEEIRMAHISEWDDEYEEEKQHLYTQRRAELVDLRKRLISERMWDKNFVHWTFSISENGLYCMLKKGARPGDILAVLDGGKVPVVLRAVEGDESRFRVVGTAYVHGYMDGKAQSAVDSCRLTQSEVLLV